MERCLFLPNMMTMRCYLAMLSSKDQPFNHLFNQERQLPSAPQISILSNPLLNRSKAWVNLLSNSKPFRPHIRILIFTMTQQPQRAAQYSSSLRYRWSKASLPRTSNRRATIDSGSKKGGWWSSSRMLLTKASIPTRLLQKGNECEFSQYFLTY